MYSLLHQGSSTRISPSPLPLADSTVSLLVAAFKTLNALALIDVFGFQVCFIYVEVCKNYVAI